MDADAVSIAYHEAGHAVVARVLDVQVKRIAICPRDGEFTLSGRMLRSVWAIINMAGPAAEQRYARRYAARYTNDEKATFWGTTWSADLRAVLRDYRGSIGDALHEAKRLVRQHWGAIERVAEALIERGELSGDEVDRIARAGHGGPHQWR